MVLISGVVLEGGLHVGSSGGRIESVANFVFIYLHVAHENRLLAKSFHENRFTNQDALKHHDPEKNNNLVLARFSAIRLLFLGPFSRVPSEVHVVHTCV